MTALAEGYAEYTLEVTTVENVLVLICSTGSSAAFAPEMTP